MPRVYHGSSTARINNTNFAIPATLWEQLGSPPHVQLWYRCYDTVITAAPFPAMHIGTSSQPFFRMKQRDRSAEIMWYDQRLRHLVVWKRGEYQVGPETVCGIAAVVAYGTNAICIDEKPLNEWRTTNMRILGPTKWATGLLAPRPRGRRR